MLFYQHKKVNTIIWYDHIFFVAIVHLLFFVGLISIGMHTPIFKTIMVHKQRSQAAVQFKLHNIHTKGNKATCVRSGQLKQVTHEYTITAAPQKIPPRAQTPGISKKHCKSVVTSPQKKSVSATPIRRNEPKKNKQLKAGLSSQKTIKTRNRQPKQADTKKNTQKKVTHKIPQHQQSQAKPQDRKQHKQASHIAMLQATDEVSTGKMAETFDETIDIDILALQLKQEIFKYIPAGVAELPSITLQLTIDNKGKVIDQKPKVIKPLVYHSAIKRTLAAFRFPVGMRNKVILVKTT